MPQENDGLLIDGVCFHAWPFVHERAWMQMHQRRAQLYTSIMKPATA